MYSLEPSSTATAGLEYSIVAEEQEKDLKTAPTNIIDNLQEEINKSLKAIQE